MWERPAPRGSGATVGLHGVTLDVMRPPAVAATLSGRADERARLLDVVRGGLDGSPRAVLVHGEAGVGKTTLVRRVCEEVTLEGAQVLWGQCLRFGAVEAMYHPLVLALEGWLAEAATRAGRVIEAVPGAALILPSLGALPADRPSTLMTVVDALLSRVIARGPTVLVVDDVQWADPATWDALTYLVAGFARQRMALLTTHRDEAAFSEASSTGWATSAACRAPRSWCWPGSTRTPPPTRSPCCSVGHRSHVWWSRCSRSRGATRTSASCSYGAATSAPPSCPRTCPMSSTRRCWRPGGGCHPRRGSSPGSSPLPAAPPTCERWPRGRGARRLRCRVGP